MTCKENRTECRSRSTGDGLTLDLLAIESLLARRSPLLCDLPERTQAAVAMILRESAAGLEVLLIERAPHDRDPWSGDLGFPGGKLEPGDLGLRQTAERETREELGLDLAAARLLGRLDDIPGAHLPVVVAGFAFGLSNAPQLVPGAEIKSAFWVPLRDLFDPGRRLDARVHFNGQELTRPALQLPLPGRTILWGITFRMVTGLRERLDIP